MLVNELTATGEFIKEHECQKCQMTGDWLYPSFYTNKPRPEVGEFKKARFSFEQDIWIEEDCLVGKVLYHKGNRSSITINDSSKKLSDYPEYTDVAIPEPLYAVYYDYSEIGGWFFNLPRYKADACNRVTALCVIANYAMFPQHKRDNVYSGSPVTDNYPDYLKGEAGKASIAKLNAVYQEIALIIHKLINSEDIKTKEQILDIIEKIVFPTETEILNLITVIEGIK